MGDEIEREEIVQREEEERDREREERVRSIYVGRELRMRGIDGGRNEEMTRYTLEKLATVCCDLNKPLISKPKICSGVFAFPLERETACLTFTVCH